MATVTFAPLKLSGLQKADDLAGVRDDLRSAADFAARLSNAFKPESYDGCLVDALTVALLIRYARAFDGARGAFLRDSLEKLPAELGKAHESFYLWRSKHIAHSVNDFEQNTVVAQYRIDEDGAKTLQAVQVHSERVVSLSEADVDLIQSLIRHFHDLVESELKDEQKRLFEIAQEFPIDDVVGEPLMTNRTGQTKIKKSRPREK